MERKDPDPFTPAFSGARYLFSPVPFIRSFACRLSPTAILFIALIQPSDIVFFFHYTFFFIPFIPHALLLVRTHPMNILERTQETTQVSRLYLFLLYFFFRFTLSTCCFRFFMTFLSSFALSSTPLRFNR